MTGEQRETLTFAISDGELERRWSAVRARMKHERIDFLVMQDQNEWLGGYVKWFTDVPARNGYPVTVLFPVDDLMTVVHGREAPGRQRPPRVDPEGRKEQAERAILPERQLQQHL